VILPLLLLAGGGWFGIRAIKKHYALTPARQAAFDKAMNDVTLTPEQLRGIAQAFEKAGLETMATALRKRAALKEAPPEVKAARREVFTKALNSNDPALIEKIADAHEQIGAVGAAQDLRLHAESVKAVKDA